MTTEFFKIGCRFLLTLFLFKKLDDRQLMKEFLPEFRPELLEAADFNLYMFPHRLIHTHMPGRRVSKSDLICFPSFITQIRPIMTLKSNNLYSHHKSKLPICISCLKKPHFFPYLFLSTKVGLIQD